MATKGYLNLIAEETVQKVLYWDLVVTVQPSNAPFFLSFLSFFFFRFSRSLEVLLLSRALADEPGINDTKAVCFEVDRTALPFTASFASKPSVKHKAGREDPALRELKRCSAVRAKQKFKVPGTFLLSSFQSFHKKKKKKRGGRDFRFARFVHFSSPLHSLSLSPASPQWPWSLPKDLLHQRANFGEGWSTKPTETRSALQNYQHDSSCSFFFRL